MGYIVDHAVVSLFRKKEYIMAISQKTLPDFVTVLASKEAVPGGGGASALVGAIGTALGNMVGSLTVGKKKYADVETEIIALKKKSDALQDAFLKLIDKDAEDFEPLSKAYGLPKETPEQQTEKDRVMEAALRDATATPYEIMKKCAEAIDIIEGFAAKGSKLAISDAGVGVIFCKAALSGASLNVFINTKAMKDRSYAEKINKEADALLSKYEAKAEKIFALVKGQLR
jgi:formiminotetrahydrofolate cyclodeaminase